jgi:hypothetical protein
MIDVHAFGAHQVPRHKGFTMVLPAIHHATQDIYSRVNINFYRGSQGDEHNTFGQNEPEPRLSDARAEGRIGRNLPNRHGVSRVSSRIVPKTSAMSV